MNRLPLVLTLLALRLSARAAVAQNAGDRVVVIREAKIRTGDAVVGVFPVGQALEVFDVRGETIFVSDVTTGWISKADVTDPERAVANFSDWVRRQPKSAEAHLA